MPDLSFEVRGVAAVPHAATPVVAVEIAVRNAPQDEKIQTVALQCQVRIEPQRRAYSKREEEALGDLFGEPGRWEQTLRPLFWTSAGVMIPAFTGETVARLHLPCTYDLAVASARYFHALAGGEAPLLLLFSGTVFHLRADGALQAAPVPWSKEARAGLPASVWQETMDLYYPNSAPLLLRRDILERLHRHRSRGGFTSWEEALSDLLPEEGS